MTSLRVIVSLAALLGLGACGNSSEVICGRDTKYLDATSAATLRIPDDLSVPDESEGLTIPGGAPAGSVAGEADSDCLQESPAFSTAPQP
jgi:uncharacterized lipoprotein